MTAATAGMPCLAIALTLAFLASGNAQAVNRCVDAKGKTLPLAACADDALAPPEPGTYSTLPQRTPLTRGPKAQVYSSNPHPGSSLAVPRDGSAPMAVPLVVQLGDAGTAGALPNATSTGKVAASRSSRASLTPPRTP